MKKLTLLLATMLLSAMSFAADEVYKTALFGSSYNSKGVKDYKSTWSATNNGFTVDIANANNNNNGWAYIKMGSKKAASVGTITTHVAIDEAITKVVLTIDAVTANAINSLTLKTQTAGGEWTDAGTFTIAKGTQSVVIATPTENMFYQIVADCKKATDNGPIQISKVEYYKAAPAVAVADPIISANEGTVENNGFYTSTLKVTLACETKGAEIHYTTDGSEPTAESATYSEVLTFTNEFVTLRAKAFKGEDASYEAKANYYHNSSLEVPYTTTQAVALYKALLKDVAEVFVEGQVTDFNYSGDYKNADYTITDGTTTLKMYRGVAGADCGLADLANLVQGDKVVVKGKLTAYNGTPQLGAGNTIVKWTENTDPVLTCAESVAFGNISSLVGNAPSKTLEVTAKNLTDDITVTLSKDAAFTLSTTTLPAEGGSIEITPVLTVGENTATLTLSSGEKSVTVTLTATIKQAYTISWVVDNKEYTAGNPTTDVIEGGKVSVLPTAPADNTLSCSNIFVGWSTNNIGSTAGQTQPADLFTSTGAAPAVTENTTYHAVFATADGEAKEYFKETFDKTNGTGGNDGKWSGSIASSTLTTDNTGWAFTKEGGANQCAKFGIGSAQGSATTPVLTGLTGSAVLTFRAGAWSGDATTLNLSISEGKLSVESVTLADAAFSTYTITITGATAESKITFEAAQVSSARFFLDEVVVKNAVTLKDFRTNCEGVSTAIDNAAVEIPAVKTIENGQLVILRDGVKYNAMGVRLQ